METILARLQDWYASQCNGDWEHGDGISIHTLDNPGWRVKINLSETRLEGRHFDAVARGLEDESSTDWLSISVKDGRTFEGVGDPSKLSTIVETFLAWAEL